MRRGIGTTLAAILLCTAAAGCATTPATTAAVPAEITIAGSRVFPESITSDAAGNNYVGSNPGTVYRALKGEAVASPWIVPDAANGLLSVFGVLADDTRGLLWLCTNPNTLVQPPQTGIAAVKAFSLADGSLVASYPFPADAGPSLCNDITIADNGDLYASDTVGGRILLLPNGGNGLRYWAKAPEFAGIDGISFGPGGALYANNIQKNTLLLVGIEDNGQFDNVTVLETSQPMGGPDGLRLLDDRRMLQSEGNAGTITVLTFPEGEPVRIETIASSIDYASSVTVANGRVWFPEGKLSYLFDPAKKDASPDPFVIRSVPLPEAP